MQSTVLEEIAQIMNTPKAHLSNTQKELLLRAIESKHSDLFIQIEHCPKCNSIIANIWVKQAIHHS